MKTASSHEQLRLKITAFLFNRRADVIREEIYQALCLYILDRADGPLSGEQIIREIAQVLNISNDHISDSIKAIVYDELRSLAKDGEVDLSDGLYFLDREVKETILLPDNLGEERLNSTLQKEINTIALNLKPNLTKVQLDTLFEFYLDLSRTVANEQIGFILRGLGIQGNESDLAQIVRSIEELRTTLKVDEILDVNEFVRHTFIFPSETLSGYLYRLIQVNIITQLISWDPSLEYLKDTVLRDKTLYLDTSVLFVLLQTSHPLHHFLKSLLSASQKELGVKLIIHEATITEFKTVIEGANREFSQIHKALRDVAKVCLRDNVNPSEYIEESIFADFLANNIEHIDLGSWQRYYNSHTGGQLESFLQEFPLQISKQKFYVPDDRFWKIKENMARASKFQVERGRRKEEKLSFDHDAKIYYLITDERGKSNGETLSLGYDTYLLTLDGSLPYFLKEEGLAWTNTYFLFPNQWYELAFPFLRLHTSEAAKGLAFMAFSPVFPTLGELLPLELCKYIFDLGGVNLTLGSIKSVIETAMEERLLESLDPSNKDKRSREKANLQVQRMIAEKELQQRKAVEIANQKVQESESKQEVLKGEIDHLAQHKEELSNELHQIQQDIQEHREIKTAIDQVTAEYEAKLSAQQEIHKKNVEEIRLATEKDFSAKDDALAQQKAKVEELQNKYADMQSKHADMQKDLQEIRENQIQELETKKRRESERINRIASLKKTILAILMIFGMGLSLVLLYQYSIEIWLVALSMTLMGVGLVIYQWLTGRYAILAYGLGIVVAGGSILVQAGSETWLWIVPMGWEILVFSIDRAFVQKIPEATG